MSAVSFSKKGILNALGTVLEEPLIAVTACRRPQWIVIPSAPGKRNPSAITLHF